MVLQRVCGPDMACTPRPDFPERPRPPVNRVLLCLAVTLPACGADGAPIWLNRPTQLHIDGHEEAEGCGHGSIN